MRAGGVGSPYPAAAVAVEHRFHMNVIAIAAALGVLVIAAPAFFIFGRSSGVTGEKRKQVESKTTAEDTAKRIVGDAEREAENLRKTAVVTGKEELIRLRENFESE